MTIREKIARAIAVERDVDPDEHIDVFGNKAWTWYTHEADAALSVLINPDDETVERLARAVCKSGAYGDYNSAASLYRDLAMSVIVALKEDV